MKSTELRIGNWINYGGYTHKLTLRDFNKKMEANLVNGMFLPIPLTPEILEKCGFELVDQWYEGKQYMCKPLLIQSDVTGSVFHCQLDDFDIHLLSVHQLQNLYFALTNTELPITL